jgi:hypothetical protein
MSCATATSSSSGSMCDKTRARARILRFHLRYEQEHAIDLTPRRIGCARNFRSLRFLFLPEPAPR